MKIQPQGLNVRYERKGGLLNLFCLYHVLELFYADYGALRSAHAWNQGHLSTFLLNYSPVMLPES